MSGSSAKMYRKDEQELQNEIVALKEEIEAVKALNGVLSSQLMNLRQFREDLNRMDGNYKQLAAVNSEWVKLLPKTKN